MLLNRLNETIQKEHKAGISGVWDKEGTNMEMVMREVTQFAELIGNVPYYMLPEIKGVVQNYLQEQIEAKDKKA